MHAGEKDVQLKTSHPTTISVGAARPHAYGRSRVNPQELLMTSQEGAMGCDRTLPVAVLRLQLQVLCPWGTLPGNVTHFVIDTTANSVVGHVILPNAVKEETSVSVAVKVPNASASYQIGTFDERRFPCVEFSERTQSHQQPTSPRGHREQDDGPLRCFLSLAPRRAKSAFV